MKQWEWCLVYIVFLCYAQEFLISSGYAQQEENTQGLTVTDYRVQNFKDDGGQESVRLNDQAHNDASDPGVQPSNNASGPGVQPPYDASNPDVLDKVGYLALKILDVMKENMEKEEPASDLGYDGDDLLLAIHDVDDPIGDTIPISQLPERITETFRVGAIKSIVVKPDEMPSWVFRVFEKKIEEHRFRRRLLCCEVTLDELPVWSIELFAAKPTGSFRDAVLSYELPSWIIEQIKGKVEEMNELGTKYRLMWNDIPFWVIRLVKSTVRKFNGGVGFLNNTVKLEEVVKCAITSSVGPFLADHPGSKLTLNLLPKWVLEFLKFKLESTRWNEQLMNFQLTLNEILEWALMVTRINMIENISGTLVKKCSVNWTEFPEWLVEWLSKLINNVKITETIVPIKPPAETVPWRQERPRVLKPSRGKILVNEKPPWSVSREIERHPTKPSPTKQTEYWLDRIVKKKIYETGEKLKVHEIPNWIIVIMKVKVVNNVDQETILSFQMSMEEIMDWAIFLTKANYPSLLTKPKLKLKDLPSWALLLLQKVVKENKEGSNEMLVKMTLDVLLDWALKVAIDEKEGTTEKVELDKFPDWIKIYIEMKMEDETKLIPPWSPEYKTSSVISKDKMVLNLSRTLRGLPEWVIELTLLRILDFNDGKLAGKFIDTTHEIPAWAVELIKIKVQSHYGRSLIMPQGVTWDTTPYWVIEFLKMKIYQHSLESSLMEHRITILDVLDFSIWFANMTNNQKDTQVKSNVTLLDIPDWALDFFRMNVNLKEDIHMALEQYMSLSELLDWAIDHNIRRKWGVEGERIMMFKDKLRGLPSWAINLLKNKVKMYNGKMPPKNFRIPIVRLPNWAVDYVNKTIEEHYSPDPSMKPGLKPDELPYWLLEFLQMAISEHKEISAAMSKTWTIDELLQWSVWITKMKSFDAKMENYLRVTQMPDWVFELLKTMLEGSKDDKGVMEYYITTEEILIWAIKSLQKKTEVLPIIYETKIPKEIPDWARDHLEKKVTEINGVSNRNDFKMPTNQLPLWSLELIEKNLENFNESDMKLISYGVIEFFQSIIQDHESLNTTEVSLRVKMGGIVDWALLINKRRKMGTGVNVNVTLEEIPEWALDLLVKSKKEDEHDSDVFTNTIRVESLIDLSICVNVEKRQEREKEKGINVKGLPLWLIKIINLKLKEGYADKFLSSPFELPTWAKVLIEQKVAHACSCQLGVKHFTPPSWLVRFLQIKIQGDDLDDSVMQKNITMDELLEFSIWLLKTSEYGVESSIVTFLDLPDWIYAFLLINLSGNEDDRMILQSTMALSRILDLGITFSVTREIENEYYIDKAVIGMPDWIKQILVQKTKLINSGEIQFSLTNAPPPPLATRIIEGELNKIYGKNSTLKIPVTWETTPYWIIEFIKLKINQQNSDSSSMVSLNDIVDFGMWITRHIKNSGNTTITRELRFFDIPYWVIELFKTEAARLDEKMLMEDRLSLEHAIDIAIHSSITRQTCKINDLMLPSLESKLNTIPSWIKEVLRIKVQKYNDAEELKKFEIPTNQLPTWAVDFIKDKVDFKHEEMQKNKTGKLWDSVPCWIAQIVQSLIQENHGSVYSMEREITVDEVVDWAIRMTDEKKRELGMKENVMWTEMPEWLVEFLESNEEGHVSLEETMEFRVQLGSLLDWAIEKAISPKEISKVINSLKDIPSDIIRFIKMELEKLKRGQGKYKFGFRDGALPPWAADMINETISAAYVNNPELLSIVMREMSKSWVAELFKFSIYRLKYQEQVTSYKATMREIVEFAIWYTFNLFNEDDAGVKHVLELTDVPGWLIELIRSKLRVSEDPETFLMHTMSIKELLKWSVINSISVQFITLDDVKIVDLSSTLLEIPPWILTFINKEINLANNRIEAPSKHGNPIDCISISMIELLKEIVEDKFKEIKGTEPENELKSVPYWVMKFIQDMLERHRGSEDIMAVNATIREVINCIILWIREVKMQSGVTDEVKWNDFPQWIVEVLISFQELKENPDKISEITLTLEDVVNFAISATITGQVEEEDVEVVNLELGEIPESIIVHILSVVRDENKNSKGYRFMRDTSDLPPWFTALIEESVKEIYDIRPDLMSFIINEMAQSWIGEYLKILLGRLKTQQAVMGYRITFEEVVKFVISYIRNVYNVDEMNEIHHVRLSDLPECFIILIADRVQIYGNFTEALASTIKIEDLLRWSIINSMAAQTVAPEVTKIPHLSSTRVEIPPWIVTVIENEINHPNDGDEVRQRRGQLTNHIPISIMKLIKEMVGEKYKEIEGTEPENKLKLVPYWAIKFTQDMLEKHRGSRDTMAAKITIKEIINWIMRWVQDIKVHLGMDDKVTWNDFPQWSIDLLISYGKEQHDHEAVMEATIPVQFVLEIGINATIKEEIEMEDMDRVNSTFVGLPPIIMLEIVQIVRDANQEKINNRFNPVVVNLPPWGTELVEHTVMEIFGNRNDIPFIARETVPYCIVEYLKTLIDWLKTEEQVMKYTVPMDEIIKFGIICTQYIYNANGTSVAHDLRLIDMPGWLIKFILNSVKDMEDIKMGLGSGTTVNDLLRSVINNSISTNTIKNEDLELSNLSSVLEEIPEWLHTYLQILLNKHYGAIKPKDYERPKNQLPIWMIDAIKQMVENESREMEYAYQGNVWDLVPYWVIQFAELMLEKHKGSKNVMNATILISEAVELAIWRTKHLKRHLNMKGEVTLIELPDWLIDYMLEVGEGVSMSYLLVEGTTTVGEIIIWGIKNAMSVRRHGDDLEMVSHEVAEIPVNAIKFIMTQIVRVNKYRDHKKYNTSEFIMPPWAERTIKRTVKEYYGNKVGSKIAITLETTPYWILGLIKIKLHEYRGNQSMLKDKMNMKEIIEYAVYLTKHVNDMDGIGMERSVRFIDMPQWLIELLLMINRERVGDGPFMEQEIEFTELLTWGIQNSIRGKIFRFEVHSETIINATALPDWITEFLLQKIERYYQGREQSEFKLPMNHLPIWAIEFMGRKVKEKHLICQEKQPDTIWGSIPYWAVQFIQSKVQEYNSSIDVMKLDVSVDEVIDWTIWITRHKKMGMGMKGKVTLTEMPRWVLKFLTTVHEGGKRGEHSLAEKNPLERIIWWAINITVEENLEEKDLSSLQSTLKGIPSWATELIRLKVTKFNSNHSSNKFDSNVDILPQWALNRIYATIEKLYFNEPGLSPIVIAEATPAWITVLLKYIIQQHGSDISVLECELTMEEILEFALWLTESARDRINTKCYIRFIDLPYWLLEVIKSIVAGIDNVDRLLSHRVKLDKLLVWSIHNSLRITISAGDGGEQSLPEASIENIPIWLRGVLEEKILENRKYGWNNRFVAPVNQLPIWIFEQIQKKREEISEVQIDSNYNTTVPFWAIELIQSMIWHHGRIKDVLNVGIKVEVIVHWAISDIERKKAMLGNVNEVKLTELPRWLINLILNIQENEDPIKAMNHEVTLEEILTKSMIASVKNKKDFEKLPHSVIRMLQLKLRDINNPIVPEKFRAANRDLPTWAADFIITKVEEHYANATGAMPMVSWDTVQRWLIEYLKIKISENDVGPVILRHYVNREEVLDFALWFTKKWTITNRDLVMDDIPDWALKFIEMMMLTVDDDERPLEREMMLDEVVNWATWFAVKQKLESEGLWGSKSYKGLPVWMTHYLQVKVQNSNKGIEPRSFHMPDRKLPPWAVKLIKLTTSEVYEENPDVSPSLSWSTLPYWVLELFQSKIEEHNGSIETVSVNMKVDEIVDWSIWITKVRRAQVERMQNLTLDDIPDWTIELLHMKLEGDVKDRMITEHDMTMDVVLLWSMRNTMQKRGVGKEAMVHLPDWLRVRIDMKIKESKTSCARTRFRLSYHPIPIWLKEMIMEKMEEIFGLEASEELQTCWDVLPHWTKELLRMKAEEMDGDKSVMLRKMTVNEILNYALWLAQKKIGENQDLAIKDVPEWVIEFIMSKMKGKFEDSAVMNRRVKLEEIIDYAVRAYKRVKDRRIEVAKHMEISEKGLPAWVKEFLERIKADYNTKPNGIPDWVPEIMKAELEQSNAQKVLIKDYMLIKYLGCDGHSTLSKEDLKSGLLDVINTIDPEIHLLKLKVENWLDFETNKLAPFESHGGVGGISQALENDDATYKIEKSDGFKKVLTMVLNYADDGLHTMKNMIERWQTTDSFSQRFGLWFDVNLFGNRQKEEMHPRHQPITQIPKKKPPPPVFLENSRTEVNPLPPRPSSNTDSRAKEILLEIIKMIYQTIDKLKEKVSAW